MIPPLQSSVMSAENINQLKESKDAGRPKKEEGEKSDKTL
jgi:hypothetical protein